MSVKSSVARKSTILHTSGTVLMINRKKRFGLILPDGYKKSIHFTLLANQPISVRQRFNFSYTADFKKAFNLSPIISTTDTSLKEKGCRCLMIGVWQRATLLWYDTRKKFGFVRLHNDGRDVFVHHSVLDISDIKIGYRIENIQVLVKVGLGLQRYPLQVTNMQMRHK